MGRQRLNLKYLSIDLTHACNLSCDFCGKRINERRGAHMTKDQLAVVLKFVTGYKIMHISGGEPLVHPYFNAMMRMILERFNRVAIATNGIALSRVDKDIYDKLGFHISVYPGVNDDIVSATISHSNVIHRKAAEYYDPCFDPDLSDEDAKRVYTGCVFSMAKVIVDKVYACCHGETVEYFYDVGEMGVTVDENWRKKLQEIERWKACKHCFIAPRSYGYAK